MSKLREQIEKDYGVDKGALEEGVWYRCPNSNLELLVKPATFHNKDLQRRDLELDFKKKYGKDFFFQETAETREAVAELYFETVVSKSRIADTKEEELMTLDDLKWLFREFAPVARAVVLFCIDPKNFRLIKEEEAKN